MTISQTTVSVEEAVARARIAQQTADGWNQVRVDDVVAAVGWQFYTPSAVHELTELAFHETGLGQAAHMFELHRRRVLGVLGDMHEVRTVGMIDEDRARGLTKYARPVGVIAVFSPATAPTSGIATCVLQALKTRNAAVICPNPRARRVAAATVGAARRGLAAVGAPEDLVQWLDPASREISECLMSAADLVVAAGGPGTVRRAYCSGTPALSAGAGNPTAIVDETANVDQAARCIVYGAGFNNGTSCSSESNVLVHGSVYAEFAGRLVQNGAHLCDDPDSAALMRLIWTSDGRLNRAVIGRSHTELAELAGIHLHAPRDIGALVIPCGAATARDDVVFGQKMSPVFTISVFTDFPDAIRVASRQIGLGGPGHSCGLHSRIEDRAGLLAQELQVCRVMVNQSTAVGNSGSVNNGMPFTAVISTGSWGGCSQSGNITWRHLINVVSVSRATETRIFDEHALFGRHADPPQEVVGAEDDELEHS